MLNEIAKMQELLAELPEVTLPGSLTAERLWARVDAGELSLQKEQQTPAHSSKIIDITKKLAPTLSYAAAFLLLVTVYYGVGLSQDKGAGLEGAPAAAEQYSYSAEAPSASPKAAARGAEEQVSASSSAAADISLNTMQAEAEADSAAPEAFAYGLAETGLPLRTAVVQVGKETLLELDLSENRTISLEDTAGIPVTLEVKDGAIRFSESDCDDKLCIQTGFISEGNQMVCCMHNQVLVTILLD